MKFIRVLATIAFLTSLLFVTTARAQTAGQETKAVNPAVPPPYLLLLVRQEFQFGKSGARQKLQIAETQASSRLDVPYSWMDLESLSGAREDLLFKPFESYDAMEQSLLGWNKIYSAHQDLARIQEQLESLMTNEDSIVAVRRDDMGYLADHIDFSEARFVRMVDVRLLPGHENDFIEGAAILADAHSKINSELPWVVYQVKLGQLSSGFLVFMPMSELKQNDDLLLSEQDLQAAEGEEGAKRLLQISREAYVSISSNLYAVNPEMSHLSRLPTENEPEPANSTGPAATSPEQIPGPSPQKPGANASPSKSAENNGNIQKQ